MKLNKDEIKLAKILDEKKLNWKRNWKGFSYIDLEGNVRKYYPDFVVNNNIFIEYKGWVTKKMLHKMKEAKTNHNLNLIIVVGEDIRYLKYGITMNKFKKLLNTS